EVADPAEHVVAAVQLEPLAVALDRAGSGERQHDRLELAGRERVRAAVRQVEDAQRRVGPAGRLGGHDERVGLLRGRSRGQVVLHRSSSGSRSSSSSRSTSPAAGIAAEQAMRDATMAPAAPANSTSRRRSHPARSPWQTAPPNASPAPRPFMTSTLTGGTSTTSPAVAARTPSGPILTMASSGPRARIARAAACGSRSPTATSHSSRLPTATDARSRASPAQYGASSGSAQSIGL